MNKSLSKISFGHFCFERHLRSSYLFKSPKTPQFIKLIFPDFSVVYEMFLGLKVKVFRSLIFLSIMDSFELAIHE